MLYLHSVSETADITHGEVGECLPVACLPAGRVDRAEISHENQTGRYSTCGVFGNEANLPRRGG